MGQRVRQCGDRVPIVTGMGLGCPTLPTFPGLSTRAGKGTLGSFLAVCWIKSVEAIPTFALRWWPSA